MKWNRKRCHVHSVFRGEGKKLLVRLFQVKVTDTFIDSIFLLTVLVLVFVVYNRRREAHIKYPGPDDDVRENIINYDDEGGGEDDMTAFDITPLQIPIGGPVPELPAKLSCKSQFPYVNCRGVKVSLSVLLGSI